MTLKQYLFIYVAFVSAVNGSEVYNLRNATNTEFDFEGPDVGDMKRLALVKDPTYLLLVQKSISPDETFRFVVNILEPSNSLMIKATLLVNSIEIGTDEKQCDTTEPQIMQIKVGSLSPKCNCKLKVEGSQLEGLTGSAFVEIITLQFRPNKLSLLVETDQTLYEPGGKVKIRVTTVDNLMKLSREHFNVSVLTPRGIIISKWKENQCIFGSVYMELNLSEYAEEGTWSVEVTSEYFEAKKSFSVEILKEELFEVTVETPPYISAENTFLMGLVHASYPSGALVRGNLSLRMGLRLADNSQFSLYVPDSDLYQGYSKFTGKFPFKLKMANFDYLMSSSEGAEVLVSATVTNFITSVTSYCSSKIFSTKIKLKYLTESPIIFQPSMTLKYYISASLVDGSPVPENRLIHHRLIVTPEVKFKSDVTRKLTSRSVENVIGKNAVWTGKIDLVSELGDEDSEWDVAMLKLPAELKDSFGHKSYASVIAVPHYSPEEKCLQITTSTRTSKVGEYTIFHVRTNSYLESFRFVVINDDKILMTGEENMNALLKTFPVAISEEMVGSTTVMVYAMPRGGHFITDAINYYVEFNNSIDVTAKIKNGNGIMASVELTGRPGILVGLSGLLSEKPLLIDWNDAREINNLESHMLNHSLSKHTWIKHNGEMESLHFPSEVIAIDANLTLRSLDLLGITDGKVPVRQTPCAVSRGFYPCMSGGGCFSIDHKCDGNMDCSDGADERNCQKKQSTEEMSTFGSGRKSRHKRDFRSSWMFRDSRLSPDGQLSLHFPLPLKQSSLILSYHAFDHNSKIYTFSTPIKLETTHDYWLQIDGPSYVGLHENVEYRVALRNTLNISIRAYISAIHSSSYSTTPVRKITNGGKLFFPSSFYQRPVKRKAETTEDIFVTVAPDGVKIVEFFVTFLHRDFSILKFEANVNGRRFSESINVFVEPPGFLQRQHTSLVVDLINSPYHFGFLNIILPKNRIHGSEQVEATIFADIVGNINYRSDLPSSLNLPTIGCESIMFNVLIDVLNLKRRQHLSNESNFDIKFAEVTRDAVQSLIYFQNSDGGFRYFRSPASSSLWLTCFVLRTFKETSSLFHRTVYIDAEITKKALRFIINQQESHGAFSEPSGTVGVKYLEAYPSFSLNQVSTTGLNLSLTALCLTQLESIKQYYNHKNLNYTLTSARRWLEENFFLVEMASPPLEVALVASAMHVTNSMKREDAFTLLARNSRQEGSSQLYWGNDKYPGANLKVENQRPHLQPRYRQRHESENIVATASALRVYTSRHEIHAGKISNWLNQHRSFESGWVAGLDTFLAKEALNEYALSSNMLQNIQMSVKIEPMEGLSSPKISWFSSDVYETIKYKLPPKADVLRVQVKGHGQAVIQVTSEYTVDDMNTLKPASTDSFTINAEAKFSNENVTFIKSKVCVSWKPENLWDLPLDFKRNSGIAVLEMALPTGFIVFEQQMEQLRKDKKLPNLIKAAFRQRQITFVLSKVTTTDTCIEFTSFQIYRVGNWSRRLSAKIYEYYSSETFTTTEVELEPQSVDSCHQCSSARCPNCPFLSYYSSSSSMPTIGILLVLITVAILWCRV